jgi:hypothetical protein
LDWVFSKVDSAIILEDDCLPVQDFFQFADEMLSRFKDSQQIGVVCGTNPLEELPSQSGSYFYSTKAWIWGWATWARVWREYDGSLSDWPDQRASSLLKDSLYTSRALYHLRNALDLTYRNLIDTWDYQLTYQLLKNGQLCVIPKRNLVSNIGFGPGATHTFDASSPMANVKRSSLDFPLSHPEEISAHVVFDRAVEQRFTPSLGRLLISGLSQLLPKKLVFPLRKLYAITFRPQKKV